MLKRIREPNQDSELVTITVEGEALQVPLGETVLASVMAAGFSHNRTSPISGAHRAGYCQMGVCFECLMEINGIPNQQACAILVEEGMVVNRQRGKGGVVHG
jgi:D-hydroxyproline dehydrogenase subunit gamma